MADLLRKRGHGVDLLERSSEMLGGARGRGRAAAAMLRGGLQPDGVTRAVEKAAADVVHVHNLNPLFGPRSLAAARASGARVVMHLHNYRLVCAIAIAYRDGRVCTRCHGRNTLPGVRLRCRGNLPEAAVYGAALGMQQPRVLSSVDRFVAPSRAARERLATLGVPPAGIDVLHNFVPESEFATASEAISGEHALYAGRLVEEKGVDVAIEAARTAGVPLVVAGDGPDRGRLEALAAGAPVRFTGRLSAPELARLRRRTAFCVMPSRWDEPCPYSALEAMAAGLPVLVSDQGGLPELAGEEAALPARAVPAWSDAMAALWRDRDRRVEAGDAMLARARERFGPERFYRGLMDVYERAGAVR
jgi:glycosyltransferase involved in cell wall biosynthesis